jgi:hypothetical protein
MSATVQEAYKSGVLGGDRAEMNYLITGADDLAAAYLALCGAVATTYQGLVLDAPSVRVDVLCENAQGITFTGTVAYKANPRPQTGDSSYEFDTSGGSEHITQSLSTKHSYTATGHPARNFKGTINVSDDGPQGVDIERAAFRWSETHYLPAEQVNAAYIAKVFALSKCVNSDTFTDDQGCQFAPGEVLFLGVKGSQRGEGDWELTFSFAAQKNRTNLVIGDITGIEKKGWEYIWVFYEQTMDADKHWVATWPIHVRVEQVYYEASFADLGLTSGT